MDTLINIACIMNLDLGYFLDISTENFEKDVNINLKGTFFFIKYALPEMLKNGKGRIVSFSSIGAVSGSLGHVVYSACKAGIESMTRSIASQYGKQNIRANCIRPGMMLNERNLQYEEVREYRDLILSHIPFPRIGDSADAAPLALFLASDESDFINGITISLDGGMTCHEPQWKEDMMPENINKMR